MSRKTGLSRISDSLLSKMSKKTVLPREKSLRDKAETKDLKQRLADIENGLSEARGETLRMGQSD